MARAKKTHGSTRRTSQVEFPGVISHNEIYTVEELFKRVGISEAGIRAARLNGLVVKRFGRKKVVRGSDIANYLDTLPEVTK